MAKPTEIAVSTYQQATRDSELARFQMFSAYTAPGSLQYFNLKAAPEHSILLPYNEEMSNSAWVLIKSIFVQTERLAQARSINEFNAYPVFSLESLARMIKKSEANTKVTAYSARQYVWDLICDFQEIYHSRKSTEEIAQSILNARFARNPKAHEIRALLAPDSICNLDFMKRFPDKLSTQTDIFRYHCLRTFQTLVEDGRNLILGLESSFADPMVACVVIDALERLCVAPFLAADVGAVEFFVGTHYCTSSTRTTLVDNDMKTFLCSYGIPFTEDWENQEKAEKAKEALENAKAAQEGEQASEPKEKEQMDNQASQEAQMETAKDQKEPAHDDQTERSRDELKADSKPTDGASE